MDRRKGAIFGQRQDSKISFGFQKIPSAKNKNIDNRCSMGYKKFKNKEILNDVSHSLRSIRHRGEKHIGLTGPVDLAPSAQCLRVFKKHFKTSRPWADYLSHGLVF
jgi:hypothetical protein